MPYQDIHFMPSAELFKAGVAEPTVAQEATETAPVKAVSVSTEEAEEVVNQRIKDICDAQIRLLIAANQPGPSTSPPPGAVAETIAPTEEQVEPDLLAHTKKDAVNEEEQNEEADDNEKQRLDDNHTGTTTSGADLADVLQATEKGRGKKSRRGRSNKKN